MSLIRNITEGEEVTVLGGGLTGKENGCECVNKWLYKLTAKPGSQLFKLKPCDMYAGSVISTARMTIKYLNSFWPLGWRVGGSPTI